MNWRKQRLFLHFLLDKPEDMEVTKKPSAERGHNFVCTISSTTIPIESALADDNDNDNDNMFERELQKNITL